MKTITQKQADALIRALEAMLDAAYETDATIRENKMSVVQEQAATLLEEIKFPPPSGVTVNTDQELYVIPAGGGYSCLGFDVLLSRYNSIAAWLRSEELKQDDLSPEARGTMQAYTGYKLLMDRAQAYCQRNNLRCPAELTPQLSGLEGKRVEVVGCDGKRRRFWVGRSTGWMPCHLMIARRTSNGGPAVIGAPFQSVRVVS